MRTPHGIYYKHFVRRAFTLVEVVASLMLLGTLLVGILAAHRRHTAQVRAAQTRLAAVAAADRLLETWHAQGAWGATKSAGVFPDSDQLTWRWTITSRPELRALAASVGRLDVLAANSDNPNPILSLEILTDNVATSQERSR